MQCETEDFVDFFLFSSLGDFSKCVCVVYVCIPVDVCMDACECIWVCMGAWIHKLDVSSVVLHFCCCCYWLGRVSVWSLGCQKPSNKGYVKHVNFLQMTHNFKWFWCMCSGGNVLRDFIPGFPPSADMTFLPLLHCLIIPEHQEFLPIGKIPWRINMKTCFHVVMLCRRIDSLKIPNNFIEFLNWYK